MGNGGTITHAKIGCIAESLERYNSSFFNQLNIYCSYDEIKHNAIHPQELLNFSKKQYANRATTNTNVGSFNQIPIEYDGSNIRWTEVHSVNGVNSTYVPSSYCYLNYPYDNEISFCPGDTNGCASGNTIEEAIFYAILELIERDSVALWWYNRLKYPCINIDRLEDPYLRKLCNSHRQRGRNFHIIDITSDLKIPTFVSVSTDQEGNRIYFGTSSHLDPVFAISRSIHELNQIMTREVVNPNFSLDNVHRNERELAKWVLTENINDHPHLKPSTTKDLSLENYAIFKSDDFKCDIDFIVDILNKNNLKAYWLNLSYVNINFYTVRVIIPSLRHFWKRLASGRLYEVPVNLGLLPRELSEEEMNPIPYFL